MKKFIIGFLGLSALVISGLLIFVAIQPEDFSVERTTVAKAPPSALFDQVNDLKSWDSWNAFERDPNAKIDFSETSQGKGAKMNWAGNEKVGEGSMAILESTPHEKVVLEQVFVKPMAGKAVFIFKFTPDPSGTKVSWRMEGKHADFMSKAVCTFMNLDSTLGPKFEAGLAKMKDNAEKAAK